MLQVCRGAVGGGTDAGVSSKGNLSGSVASIFWKGEEGETVDRGKKFVRDHPVCEGVQSWFR